MTLILDALTKVFGPNPQSALHLVDEGLKAAEIRARTGHTVALRDISLTIPDRQTTVIMGLSGSGKSTLVRLINRLIEPTRGRVVLEDGESQLDVTALGAADLRGLRRERMAMVFQHFALLPHRTVLDNAAYGLEISGVAKKDRHAAAAAQLAKVGLSGYEYALPNQLSGGMRQRVGLARALATQADILLMDEPFSALDPLIRKDMQDLLQSLLAEEQRTLVFITHDLDEALRLGDQIALLEAGQLVQVGTPADLVLRPEPGYAATFMRDANRAKVLTAGHLAQRAPVVVREGDKPFTALREMTSAGVREAYVIDRRGAPMGVLTADAARGAADAPSVSVGQITMKIPVLTEDMAMEKIFRPLMASPHPLPVSSADRKGPFRGIVSRDSVLQALADHSS